MALQEPIMQIRSQLYGAQSEEGSQVQSETSSKSRRKKKNKGDEPPTSRVSSTSLQPLPEESQVIEPDQRNILSSDPEASVYGDFQDQTRVDQRSSHGNEGQDRHRERS